MLETAHREIGATRPGHYGAGANGIVMQEAAIACAWNLQGDAARGSIAADALRWFGLALPFGPNTTQRAQALLALWTGPRSWLLIESAASGRPAALVDFDAKREALNRVGGALFDISASRVAFTIRGARVARVLASSCPLDFDSRVFPPGSCAQSVFGRVSALYYRHETAPGFSVMVARSLAADMWHALCVAAASEGYDVAPPAAFDAG